MKYALFASALVAFASAQVSSLPSCAISCFAEAAGKTDCGLTDYYCQCTTGAAVIAKDAFACLCKTFGTAEGCSASDLMEVQKASNGICSAALSASSQTYTAATAAIGCSTGTATMGTSMASTTSSGGTAMTTGGTAMSSMMSGTSAAGVTSASASGSAASASSVSPASNAAPAATRMALLGFEGAALGLAGMAMFAM